MLATIIQRYEKNHFIFDPVQELKFYRLSGATFYDCIINTIYQFIKHFLDNEMSIFDEYGTFNLRLVYMSKGTFCDVAQKNPNLASPRSEYLALLHERFIVTISQLAN